MRSASLLLNREWLGNTCNSLNIVLCTNNLSLVQFFSNWNWIFVITIIIIWHPEFVNIIHLALIIQYTQYVEFQSSTNCNSYYLQFDFRCSRSPKHFSEVMSLLNSITVGELNFFSNTRWSDWSCGLYNVFSSSNLSDNWMWISTFPALCYFKFHWVSWCLQDKTFSFWLMSLVYAWDAFMLSNDFNAWLYAWN